MSREKSVIASTIAVDDIYQMAYLRIVCGAPSCYKRLHYLIINSTSQRYTQTSSCNNEQDVADIAIHHDDNI